MVLGLPSSILVWDFYSQFLSSSLCPLERRSGDKIEKKVRNALPFFSQSFFVLSLFL
jgi:hypothetical protein